MKNNHYIKALRPKKATRTIILIAVGILLGWLLFGESNQSPNEQLDNHQHSEHDGIWTCSMHPQIRRNEPGDCPLCGMDLIPLKTSSSTSNNIPEGAMQLTPEAIALANIQTSLVSRNNPVKEVLLYGVVQPDERNLQSQTAHVGGRIEELYINFTGEKVRKGQKLATIYSPELYAAQQELFEAVKLKSSQPQLFEAAKEKLRLWKLTDRQIDQIVSQGVITPTVTIVSNSNGIVLTKQVSPGDYISQGTVLYEVADLSKLWVMFEAYENDLAFINTGDKIDFTIQALPGKTFYGTVSFIDPIINATTRTAKVRVEIVNPQMIIKPQMYATGVMRARLQQYKDAIVIPQTAVLWTGKRSIVYVKINGFDLPTFELREVVLGPSLGNSYVIISGLNEGEEIVTNGTYAIDASAQLEGKRSMMNKESGHKISGHEGHNMHNQNGIESHEAASHSMVEHNPKPQTKSNVKAKHSQLKVSGNCDMCNATITKAAMSVKGVNSAKWNKSTKILQVDYSTSTTLSAISKAIANAGYDTELNKGSENAYNGLPACCKYRK